MPRPVRHSPLVGLRHFAALLLVCLTFGSQPGRAADIFIKPNGITGGAVEPGHVGWINASGLKHSVASQQTGGGGGGGGGIIRQHALVEFSKPVDAATPLLCAAVSSATPISDVQIEFVQEMPPYLRFYKITLTDAYVSSVTTAAATAGAGETVKLFYSRINWTYTEVNRPGQPSTTTGWNVVANTGTLSTNLADTDLDGMPDSYETASGLNPNVNDANGDLDGDGLTNYQEFLAGTLPNDFNSVFRVSRINLTNGLTRVTWTSVAGRRTYTIRAAANVNGPYTPVRTVNTAGDGETFSDFTATPGQLFYRVTTP